MTQQDFWRGEFGDAYTERNQGQQSAVVARWARMLARTHGISSVFEIGTNTGNNLDAIKVLLPDAILSGIEINQHAQQIAFGKGHKVALGTAQSAAQEGAYDLVFTSGVLIHIPPIDLPIVYSNLVRLSKRYVLVAEYYNPTPVEVLYRGHPDKLFKRDFAGEIMDAHGLVLKDYGFVYRRDPLWPADDLTWFLMMKLQ